MRPAYIVESSFVDWCDTKDFDKLLNEMAGDGYELVSMKIFEPHQPRRDPTRCKVLSVFKLLA